MNIVKAFKSLEQSQNLSYLVHFVGENKYLADLAMSQSPNDCSTSEREAMALFLNVSLEISEKCVFEIIACTSHKFNQELIEELTKGLLQTVIEHTLRDL